VKSPKPIQAIVATPSTSVAGEDLNLRPGYEQAERRRSPSRLVAHTGWWTLRSWRDGRG